MNSTNDLRTSEDSPRSPFARTGFLAALGFLVLVIILGIAVVATRGDSDDDTPQAVAPSTHATAGQPAGNGNPPGHECRPTSVDQSVPAAGPKNVQWRLYNTVALPVSSSDGPTITEGDVARCYARTPTGALLAAAQIPVRYLVADDWRAVLNAQVAPGIGRDVYSRMRAQVTDNVNEPGDYGQIAGYQFVTYSPDLAVIQIVSRFANGSLQMVTTTVTWADGDWKLRLQDNGGVALNAQRLTNLQGVVPWGGV